LTLAEEQDNLSPEDKVHTKRLGAVKLSNLHYKYLVLVEKKVIWTCDETGGRYNFPVDDPPGKIYCNCCGKMHRLTPGELSKEDLDLIEEVKKKVKDNISFEDRIIGTVELRAKVQIRREAGDYNMHWKHSAAENNN
jgi:hypothetical protein